MHRKGKLLKIEKMTTALEFLIVQQTVVCNWEFVH